MKRKTGFADLVDKRARLSGQRWAKHMAERDRVREAKCGDHSLMAAFDCEGMSLLLRGVSYRLLEISRWWGNWSGSVGAAMRQLLEGKFKSDVEAFYTRLREDAPPCNLCGRCERKRTHLQVQVKLLLTGVRDGTHAISRSPTRMARLAHVLPWHIANNYWPVIPNYWPHADATDQSGRVDLRDALPAIETTYATCAAEIAATRKTYIDAIATRLPVAYVPELVARYAQLC